MSKKYEKYSDPEFVKKTRDSPDKNTPVVADLPAIGVGDKVVISDTGYEINSKEYKSADVENTEVNIIKAASQFIEVDSVGKIEAVYSYRANRFFVFNQDIASNPARSFNYLTLFFDGRQATIENVPVFFISRVMSEDPITLRTTPFLRDANNIIIPLTKDNIISKSLEVHDKGAINKLSYLFYGNTDPENLVLVRSLLTNTDLGVEEAKDTYKKDSEIAAEAANEKFMRDKLVEWGYTRKDVDMLKGQVLTDLYMAEQQRRAPPPQPSESASSGGSKNQITPNPPKGWPTPPVIKHDKLPETGFRMYSSKILMVTLIAGMYLLYRRSKSDQPSQNNTP